MARTATRVFQMIVRLAGLALIVLGILFWSGRADALIPLHTLVGIMLVLALLALAAQASQLAVQPGLITLAVLWGVVTPALGLTQERLLNGNAHWLIQVLHLLVGLGTIGLGELLGIRITLRRLQMQHAAVRNWS